MSVLEIGNTVSLIAGISAGAIFLLQSWRYEKATKRLERARNHYESYTPTFTPKEYVMCGGCGASVEVREDGFTPKYHACFTPQPELDFGDVEPVMRSAMEDAGYAPLSEHVEISQRKIPIGLTGHLHVSEKSVK